MLIFPRDYARIPPRYYSERGEKESNPMRKAIILLMFCVLCVAVFAETLKTVEETKKPGDKFGEFTDVRSGKKYKTVKIGNQVWMAENLAYKDESGCWAYDNDENNARTYGYLYDWETACKVCPKGWHLPSDKEWKQLEMALGMRRSEADEPLYRGRPVGTKMKSTSGWNDSVRNDNGNGTNESGFAGLPGGYRINNGLFYDIGNYGYWWSSTQGSSNYAWYRELNYSNADVYRYFSDKQIALSVRCVRD